MKLVVVDLDGTLFDTSKRFEACQNESNGNKRAFWECFQSPKYMNLDKPNWKVVDYVRKIAGKNAVLVVVSGRSAVQREETMRQLEQLKLPITEVVLRKEKDFRKDYEFKQEAIKQLVEKYRPSEVVIIDDSDSVLNGVKVNAPVVYAVNAKTIAENSY